MKLTFIGGRELAQALRRLPGAIAEEILETAVVAGVGILRAAAAEKCPKPGVRRRPRTVRLADSIKVTVTEKLPSLVMVNVGTNVPYAHLVEYGHQIVPRGPARGGTNPEFETRQVGQRQRVRTTKDGRIIVRSVPVFKRFATGRRGELRRLLKQRQAAGSRGFVAPRPFLRPAFDETKEKVLQRIGEVLEKGIEVEVRKLTDRPLAARVA